MSEYNVVTDQNDGKSVKRKPVIHYIEKTAHVVEELKSFVAEKYPQYYSYNIQPFGMMFIAPKL
jgi:hypothetical protein